MLVVLVIFVFLRNIPATIIPGLSVPLSIIGTFAVMHQLGFSLNNLSLMALTISAGFVVDDAIVMIENISRYLEQGDTPLDAAMKGAGEIGFTIVSLTVSLIAVLIPLLFMPDVVGRLFREFAITLSIAILISAVVSLTLVPMLCAKMLKSHDHDHPVQEGKFFTFTEKWYGKLVAGYDRLLIWVLGHQRFTLGVAVGTLVLTVVMYVFIPKGFFPQQDTGFIQAITSGGSTVSFDTMSQRQNALARLVLKDPAVQSLSSAIGVDGTNNTLNSGRLLINLKPKGDRDGVAAVVERLKQLGHAVPGITFYLQPVQDISTDTTVSRAQYNFVLRSATTADLNNFGAIGQDTAGHQRQHGLPRPGPCRLCGGGPRHRRPLRHQSRGRGQCALFQLRPAHHHHHVYPDQPVPRHPGGRSQAAKHGALAAGPVPARPRQQPGAADGDRPHRAEDLAAGDRPSRPIPLRQHFLRRGAGLCAGRGGERHRARRAGCRHTARHQRPVPRFGQFLPVFAFQRDLADHGCHHHGLYRAGRAL
jgi:hypothetical protein